MSPRRTIRKVQELAPLVKPRMRGVTHQYAFFISLITGTILVFAAPNAKALVAVSVYAGAITALFGTSALYHRLNWSPKARRRMRRLDHSMIFMMIAGTYTPISVLALSGTVSIVFLSIIWGGAAAGIVMKLVWIDAPSWITALVYVALGWAGLASLPWVTAEIGVTALVLILAGGLLYTAGAVVYARQKPDPVPAVFGYHEIFHVFVIVAAALHYSVVAFFVLPAS